MDDQRAWNLKIARARA